LQRGLSGVLFDARSKSRSFFSSARLLELSHPSSRARPVITAPQTASACYEVGHRKPPRHTQIPGRSVRQSGPTVAGTAGPQSAPRLRKRGRADRAGRLRCRPVQEAGNAAAFCPAAMVSNGAQPARPQPTQRRCSPPVNAAKIREGRSEARGVRRAGTECRPGPAQQGATTACRNFLFSGNLPACTPRACRGKGRP